MLLQEQKTIKKGQVNKNIMTKLNIGANKSRKYKIDTIRNSLLYARESTSHLLGLYYLVF